MSDERIFLAERFEAQRVRLRGVAYRMLGSASEAEDAVQEAWLRLDRSDTTSIDNLSGWLTTVVARVCLNMLRARATHGEVPLDVAGDAAGGDLSRAKVLDPAQEAEMADSVGLALLVVLDALAPAERLAFVLHDLFGVPFEEIAPMVDRSPQAARQLASRARRRVRGAPVPPASDVARRRRVVEAFLAAARDGDFDALVALLHPDVVLHADASASPSGSERVIRGVQEVVSGAFAASRSARFTAAALVRGAPGLVMVVRGRLRIAIAFTFDGDRISGLDVIADPERLRDVEVAVL